jgi:hypothetical protein
MLVTLTRNDVLNICDALADGYFNSQTLGNICTAEDSVPQDLIEEYARSMLNSKLMYNKLMKSIGLSTRIGDK